MKKVVFLLVLLSTGNLSAQLNRVVPPRDGFIGTATDARAAGQGDIGVATATDAFSQLWNPSKYVFSDKKFEIGVTQILGNSSVLNEFSQLNVIFYNKLDNRSAYAISIRNYAYTLNQFIQSGTVQESHEVSIDGSYVLKLSDQFSMSVSGRFISLKGKFSQVERFSGNAATSLYGIDVSGFYYGKELALKKFNARWRAGFNLSNLRGKSLNDLTYIEIYAPSYVKVGVGFDFIFDQDNILGITTEYKTLLDSYVENDNGEPLTLGLEGAIAAMGFEYGIKEKLMVRTGFSYGIDRLTDSFASLGTGFRGRYVNIDIAYLLGLSEEENLIRDRFRISLGLDLGEVFSKPRR